MQNQSFNDKEMLMDALSSQKMMTESYNQFANECASSMLLNEFLNLLSEEHQIQHDVFTELQKRGWYQLQDAPPEKIEQVKKNLASENE